MIAEVGHVTDPEDAPAPVEDARPPVPRTRSAIVGAVVSGLVLLGVAGWLFWLGATATWDAGVLLVRGEDVLSTVVEVDLNTKTGMPDELVVVHPPPYTAEATIVTRRHDIGVGAVVPVVVDPYDPSRAALVDAGWPWFATLGRLLFAPLFGLFGLFLLVWAAGPPREQQAGADDTGGDPDASSPGTPAAPGAPDGPGSDERA
ncbi:MAG: hypothetical protein K0S40_2245 [Actinomycetospora sp.]|nr:hypothetical protein [Actinomycetospora sp.]